MKLLFNKLFHGDKLDFTRRPDYPIDILTVCLPISSQFDNYRFDHRKKYRVIVIEES